MGGAVGGREGSGRRAAGAHASMYVSRQAASGAIPQRGKEAALETRCFPRAAEAQWCEGMMENYQPPVYPRWDTREAELIGL